MAPQTITCPQCRTTLRSNQSLAPDAMLRCPQCGGHFQATPAPISAPPLPVRSYGINPYLLMLVPASLFALMLGVAAIVGTYFLVRPNPAPVPVASDNHDQELADKQRQLDEANKALAAQRDQLAEVERRQKFNKLLDKGKTYLADKDYEDARSTYEGALKLYPTDQDALTGLAEALAGVKVAEQGTNDQRKRKAAFDKFMEQGQQALALKKYAEAVRYFESAVTLIPGDTAAQALADAKKELEKDKTEKDRLATYQKFITAGDAAMTAGRYTDAIREYIGALGVIPGDAVAMKGQKDAEQKLADTKDQAAVDKLVADGRSALRDKKYKNAGASALAALRILPGDIEATKLLDDAKKGYDASQADYKRLMTAAAAAITAQRYEEAKGLYTQVLQIVPDDAVALKAQQDLQNGLDGQAAYLRLMATGNQALAANRYVDAANAFTQALQLAPGDADATRGLATAQAATARLADYDRFMTIGNVALNKKLYRDAIAAFKDALVAAPDDPLAIAGLHQAKYLRGMTEGDRAMAAVPKKFTEAIVSYEEALKEKPGDKAAKDQLSTARYLKGIQEGTAAKVAKKYAEAVPLLEEALHERPNDANAKIQLREAKYGKAMAEGDAAMKAQKYDDAVTAYQDALKESPRDARASTALQTALRMKK